MDASQLRSRIKIMSPTKTQDEYGQATIVWVLLAELWVNVMAVRGREFFAAAQINQETTVKFTIRYRADITTLNRIEYDGKGYDITGVIPLAGRKEWLELMAIEGIKDGR